MRASSDINAPLLLFGEQKWIRRVRGQLPLLIVTSLLVAISVLGIAFSTKFATVRNLGNVFEQASPLGFIALGQMLVVLVGGIDLSVGAVVSICTVLLATLSEQYPDYIYLSVIATLSFGALLGALNAIVINMSGVHPLIVTIGSGAIISGCTLMYANAPTGKVPPEFEWFAYNRVGLAPVSAILLLACYLIAWVFLAYTRSGRSIYAVGGNTEAARLVGLPVGYARLLAFAGSGLLAALCGVYFVSRTGVGDPLVGDRLALSSITPVVIGGTLLGGGRGNIAGTFIGIYLVSCLNNVLNLMNMSTYYQWVAQGLIILAAVSFYHAKGGRAL
jgi:ribose transport system permease protein